MAQGAVRLVGILVALVVALSIGAGCSYNRFATQDEAVRAQWSQVENQLQRRHDLIPNLVETVKGFAQQERDVFQSVADARAKMAGAGSLNERVTAANAESSALARLLIVVEAYPQLRSNENFMRLMDDLAGTENRISTERGRYNDAARTYNTMRRRFPGNLMAGLFGFEERPYFDPTPEARTAPKVDFGKSK